MAINFHARALRGLRNGGGIVLGYDKDPTHPGKYVVNADEAAQVRRLFAIYREECSLNQTIKRLVAEGIRPKARPNRKERHNMAGRWTVSTIANVLRTQAYAGLREVNAKSLRFHERYQVVKASWEVIVDETEFRTVQGILDENLTRERKRLASATSRTFFLSGIFYCEECGRPLVGSSGHGREKLTI